MIVCVRVFARHHYYYNIMFGARTYIHIIVHYNIVINDVSLEAKKKCLFIGERSRLKK